MDFSGSLLPGFFTFSFGLLLYSFTLLLVYLEKGKPFTLYSSVGLYFFCLLFYEVYLLFILIPTILVLFHYATSSLSVATFFHSKLIKKIMLSYGIALTFYLILYIGFSLLYPSNYSGSTLVSSINWSNVWNIYKNYPSSAFSLATFYEHKILIKQYFLEAGDFRFDSFYLIQHAPVTFLVKAILVLLVFMFCWTKLPILSFKKFIAGILISLVFIYLSHSLLTISEKYLNEYSFMKGYVTAFFSFFGSVLLKLWMLLYLNSIVSFSEILSYTVMIASSLVLFDGVIKTSYANTAIANDMANARISFQVLDELSS